ncbi:hypothetical protein B0H11DRAFT_2208348 [Mycena galericulata]|nr:hypothetical protein B0H11DRAFT_2208348 [Mycena galericulata]
MPHTPPVPPHVACPIKNCGHLFLTPRDLKDHSRSVHDDDLRLECPVNGCSFKTVQLKRLEAHVETAHHNQPRQFQCLELHCGFSTTSQGALTRHYRERHDMEPPASGRKPPAPRRRAPRRILEGNQSLGTPPSRLPALPTAGFNSQEARYSASSASSAVPASAVSPPHRYYPAAAYYSSPPPQAAQPIPQPDNVASRYTQSPSSSAAPSIPFPRPCPPVGPHSNGCVHSHDLSSFPLAHPPSRDSWIPRNATWVSWRDECDVAPHAIAIATGERVYCERSMPTCMTEYLPVPEDVGMAEKRFLWA